MQVECLPCELLDTMVLLYSLPFLTDTQPNDVAFPVTAFVGSFKEVIGIVACWKENIVVQLCDMM